MTRKKSPIAKAFSSGFTLIEMSVVIVVSSLLLIAAVGGIETWMKQAALTTSQQRLNTIQQALANFNKIHHRIPCPSSFIATTAAATYGREVTYPSPNGCGINPASGLFYYTPDGANTFLATGRTGTNAPNDPTSLNKVISPHIITGALPVRDLGLPDSYRANNAGYMYTYAVTQSEASAPSNGFAGAIDVVDSLGNTALPLASDGTPGTATYVVVDPGKDGKGAYTSGGVPSVTACASVAGLDVLNCSYTVSPVKFRSAPFSNQLGASWFDDAIVYSTSLSSSTQTCTTIYSAKTAAGGAVVAGTSTGYDQMGYDAGGGGAIGFVVFIFAYSDTLTFGVNSLGYNPTSPTAVAYCPNTNYFALSGGCTQTAGKAKNVGGTIVNATGTNGPVANLYGLDITSATHEQIVLPPLSHPAMPNAAGQQGWECNGSSAKTMQTQAYVTCCTGGQ